MYKSVTPKIITRKIKRIRATVRIHFRSNTNNLFITLTDMKNKVLYTRSTGTCTGETNKRRKRTNLVVEQMTDEIIHKLTLAQKKSVQIILRTRKRRLLRPFLSYLYTSAIKVTSMLDRCKIPHNGIRGSAKPRK